MQRHIQAKPLCFPDIMEELPYEKITRFCYHPCIRTACNAVFAAGRGKRPKAPALIRASILSTVATGPTSGLYYPIGGAFSALYQTGSGINLPPGNRGISGKPHPAERRPAEVAILMSDAVAQAYEAYGPYEAKPFSELRALRPLSELRSAGHHRQDRDQIVL